MDTRIELPEGLRGVFFDRLWETSRVWRLTTQAESVPFESLSWHLDLPVWTTVPKETRWDLSPRQVLSAPGLHPRHWKRIVEADLFYPLEMFRQGARWVVMDGYHRLAKHEILGLQEVAVRRHPDDLWVAIPRHPA